MAQVDLLVPKLLEEEHLMQTPDLQLAKLWVALEEIRNKIDNEAIPLGVYLGLEDPELMQALETLSERIGKHFVNWRIVAEPRKNKRSLKQ